MFGNSGARDSVSIDFFSVAFDVNPPSNTLWFFIKEWDNQIDYRRLVCRIAEKPTTL